MDAHRLNILNESNRMLSKLQLLSVFFGDDIIYKIYLRSQVIHQMFENNPELEINKLELFHIQFTVSLVDLLRKIKKSNENNISLLFNEIQLNKEMIDKLSNSTYSESDYNLDKKRQATKINLSLRKLFQVLSDGSPDNPLSKNINSFSARYASDFFFDIPESLFADLIKYSHADVYTNPYAVIQKKLMGVLCKYSFQSEFYCGLKSGSQVIEVYKFTSDNRYFIYLPSSNLFLFCDIDQINTFKKVTNLSRKESLIYELINKNDKLKSSAGAMKSNMPAEIRALLLDDYKKLEDVNFLDNISNFDVQANILKSMLNTDMI